MPTRIYLRDLTSVLISVRVEDSLNEVADPIQLSF